MIEVINSFGPSPNKQNPLGQKLAKGNSISGNSVLNEEKRRSDKMPKIKKLKKMGELLQNNQFELMCVKNPISYKVKGKKNINFEFSNYKDFFVEKKNKFNAENNDLFNRNSSTKIINVSTKKCIQKKKENEIRCIFCKHLLSTSKLSLNILYKQYEEKALNILSSNIISDIIFNSNSRIRSIYKECLIFECSTEFLYRYYYFKESSKILKMYSDFSVNSFHLGPNYFCLVEKKYLFRNIEKKLKITYDKNKRDINEIKNSDFNNEENIFSSTFLKQIEA